MKLLGPPQKLDGRLYYSAYEAKSYLESLSLGERKLYLYAEMVDFWFMINYSWIFLLGFRRFFPLIPSIIALIPGILDFIETSAILFYLMEDKPLFSLSVLALVSTAKWALALSSCGILGFKFLQLKMQ